MFYTIIDFSLGSIFLAKRFQGLSIAKYISLPEKSEKMIESFKKKNITLEFNRKKFQLEEKLFSKYFKGEREDFYYLPLDFISGTSYQKKVWQEARKIPYGKTETYKSLAHKLNHRGYRSVGQALSKNPLLIIIPCHRVISSNGNLGGFSAGLELKRFLLRLETGEIFP